ncbi:unnamed protein product, partial [Discosporangium mesarthrocarpum]
MTVVSQRHVIMPAQHIQRFASSSECGTWGPPSVAVAGLLVIHGGMWYSGWFGPLGDLLSSEQYSIRVSAPDLPALGKSDDVVPDLRAFVPDFADYFKEVSTAVIRARAALQDGAPTFLLGESMGGLVAIMALLDEADLHVDGLILCAALVRVAPELLPPAFVTPILRLVSWFSPKTSVPQE